MATLSTSFRMYNAGPKAAAAWARLFKRIFVELALDIRVVAHSWPEPIASLWSRADLCCAFMCGWPFARSTLAMQPIAAPVPSLARYEGLPRYCSEFLVRADTGWNSLDDTFGHRFGWMADDSQSGFNAPRFELSQRIDASHPALYREVVGPLGTPARTLAALRAQVVDVVALDGYYLDLCRRHQPDVLEGLRCIATTPWTPIPLLMAAPGVDPRIVARLQARLLTLHESPAYAPLLEDALLARFVAPDAGAYSSLETMARSAVDKGYDAIR
jgi:ABC-type phosphate/phosphonate transport system substrate-binding protein